MAHILSVTVNHEGYMSIRDDRRPYPVSVCCDGTRDFIIWLRLAKNPKMRAILSNRIPALRDPMSRYLLKLAIDNSDRSDEIINRVYAEMNESHTTLCKR